MRRATACLTDKLEIDPEEEDSLEELRDILRDHIFANKSDEDSDSDGVRECSEDGGGFEPRNISEQVLAWGQFRRRFPSDAAIVKQLGSAIVRDHAPPKIPRVNSGYMASEGYDHI